MGGAIDKLKAPEPATIKKKKVNLFYSILSLILLIGVWPTFGLFKHFVFTESFSYPFCIGTLSFGLLSLCTIGYYFYWCKQHITKHKQLNQNQNQKDKGAQDLENQKDKEPNEKARKAKEKENKKDKKLSCGSVLAWLLSTVPLLAFIFSESFTIGYCTSNSNICIMFFRVPLSLSTILFLFLTKSDEHPSIGDPIVAVIVAAGIAVADWNINEQFSLAASDVAVLVLCGLLAVISFGLYSILLKKAIFGSSVKKTLLAQSVLLFVVMCIVTISYERSAPWLQMADLNILWKVLLTSVLMSIWMWSLITTCTYSNAIITAFSLQIGLFLGDLGIHQYFTLQILTIVGSLMVAIGLLWLLQKLVFLYFPSVFAKINDIFCYFCRRNQQEESEKRELLEDKSDNNYKIEQEQSESQEFEKLGKGVTVDENIVLEGSTTEEPLVIEIPVPTFGLADLNPWKNTSASEESAPSIEYSFHNAEKEDPPKNQEKVTILSKIQSVFSRKPKKQKDPIEGVPHSESELGFTNLDETTTATTNNPFDAPTTSTNNPFDGPASSTNNPFDVPTTSTNNPFDGPSSSSNNPFDIPKQPSNQSPPAFNHGLDVADRNSNNPFDVPTPTPLSPEARIHIGDKSGIGTNVTTKMETVPSKPSSTSSNPFDLSSPSTAHSVSSKKLDGHPQTPSKPLDDYPKPNTSPNPFDDPPAVLLNSSQTKSDHEPTTQTPSTNLDSPTQPLNPFATKKRK
eukprot:TRINITY_DN9195_c0_g1_i1.p1 TRINITY_DN9195_c0_g1~~TRINITY_DN9195_c0_g1_i1.p1  ORF type:complete len:749 (+),score=172.98 TRINITY_DN9195_c0_g1_i1:32-2248(+)